MIGLWQWLRLSTHCPQKRRSAYSQHIEQILDQPCAHGPAHVQECWMPGQLPGGCRRKSGPNEEGQCFLHCRRNWSASHAIVHRYGWISRQSNFASASLEANPSAPPNGVLQQLALGAVLLPGRTRAIHIPVLMRQWFANLSCGVGRQERLKRVPFPAAQVL